MVLSTSLNIKGIISSSLRSFIYSIYSDSINKSNEKKKDKVEKNLLVISDIIGKSSQRGSKIDELLGEI